MSMNGTETPADPKAAPQSTVGGKGSRVPVGPSAPATRLGSRRRRDPESTRANHEERFFLAEAESKGGIPALGRECPSEAEAIIDAFRAKVNFYRITEFQTRADIGKAGEPILKKEALKKNTPAS